MSYLGRVWSFGPPVHLPSTVTPQQLAGEKYKAWHPTSTVRVMPGPAPTSTAYGKKGLSGLGQTVQVQSIPAQTVRYVIGGSALLVLGAGAFFLWRATKNG